MGDEFSDNSLEALDLEGYEKLTHKQKIFLAAYITTLGHKTKAAKLAGASYFTVMEWFREDAEFRAIAKECEQVWTDNLERAARFRALVDSDTLLRFLLEAEKPDKYDAKIRAQSHALKAMQEHTKLEVVLVDALEDENADMAKDSD